MKRILIDGRFIGVGESMTRYCMELVQGILKLDTENEYTLLIRPQGKKLIADNLELKAENLHIEVLDIPHYSLAEQTKLLKYLKEKKFDLVHFIQFNHPVRYRGRFVVTIHDLTLFGHLHRKDIIKRLSFSAVMKSAVKNSSKIIAISKTTKDDILNCYHAPEDKIEVIYLAVDGKYNSRIKDSELRIKQFKDKYDISGEYFLYTGMWKKHKNLLRMLEAFCKFKQTTKSTIQMVIVGKKDQNEPEIIAEINQINKNLAASSYKQKAIIATGFIEEEELPVSYAGAQAYIIPSLSEGFGLPPLEAMACGTPVLSSNVSAMPEILGEAPLYFNPYDVDDMAEKMQQVASDERLRASLSAAGLEQAKKYDWQKTAEQTLGVYQEVLL